MTLLDQIFLLWITRQPRTFRWSFGSFLGVYCQLPAITKSRPMSEIGRITATTMLSQLSIDMTDFQSEQLKGSGGSNPQPQSQ